MYTQTQKDHIIINIIINQDWSKMFCFFLRLVLKQLKEDSHILRFDGTGYVAVETKGHPTSSEMSVILTFKTFAEDGLIYLLENKEVTK